MSIDAMRWAKKVKTGKSSAKAVLTWLADMCGADLCAFPSIPALAEATELDKKTVQSSLQYLVSIGLIEDTGERRGRTKQIPVYRLCGVEESIADTEHPQKREHYQKRDRSNAPENGVVIAEKPTENGIVPSTKNNQTIPFFPSNDPKNGIRNLPEEPKDITPTHSGMVRPDFPDYPNQPGVYSGHAQSFGKFAMYQGWKPSVDFPRQATLWGMPLKPGLNLPAELSSFISYWQAEGKVFHQVQWEQKLARHLNRAEVRQIKPVNGGNDHVGVRAEPAASRAVQQIRAAREQRLRVAGSDGHRNVVAPMGSDGRNLFEPMDPEERRGTIRTLDRSDWVDE
ncbi:DnaT-like ssDNA-binding domain-containing protein [Klebsiella pneumoniae]|uniref:DnaT-like ssDNA-binding domain-containing protein n=1 Tax=Klebsiella TaxID=570 RepID=UPI000DE7539D|nr:MULTISPECIES: DnaT-like ssDNA-binding domain-containing protein [Klebsiella]MCS6028665.1 helix-turn-helix domain-containing protein [Klebsiella quasipneumoniae subsp. quasipneumoniae]EKW8471553.1 helix-turn-helix domain-containing protein [Klebsiella pneumoniae]MCC3235846.1 helix-turn-helix domain-containing protein [Klebsiella pneumoniae]MCH9410796.1 DnaT-like ssDNA-binding domain-containing protein [Klebsiella pneumoniae]MCH9455115.1 DnaT-like ssDNA-binding domain-containing protein [Kleb